MYQLDDVIVLIQSTIKLDETTLQEKELLQRKRVFACKKNVGYKEFYEAKRNQFELSMKFVIAKDEYLGQRKIEYQSKQYIVIRTYELDSDFVELTVEYEDITRTNA